MKLTPALTVKTYCSFKNKQKVAITKLYFMPDTYFCTILFKIILKLYLIIFSVFWTKAKVELPHLFMFIFFHFTGLGVQFIFLDTLGVGPRNTYSDTLCRYRAGFWEMFSVWVKVFVFEKKIWFYEFWIFRPQHFFSMLKIDTGKPLKKKCIN